jgi:glycosyltransferase involved in cell wall biosynthesis
MNYAAQQWATDLYLEVMDRVKARKVFVPCGFSGLHDPAYKDYFNDMPKVLKKYDATVYLSPTYRDTVFAKEHGVSNMHIIPNGADEREFAQEVLNVRKQLRIPLNSKTIMHLGSFTGQKGQPEAMKVFTEAKLEQATLILVGNVFDDKLYRRCHAQALLFNLRPSSVRANRRIIVTQLDRPATVSLLSESDLFLFPSNIEASPLVLFESCAARTPFMSTDVGNAKEIAQWTKGGVIMPTTKDSLGNSHADIAAAAAMLRSLIVDDKQLADLARLGHKNWKAHYSWDILTKQYIKIYEGKVK